MIDSSMFPYETFPIRLEFGEKKNITVCHFQCQDHLDKYLERSKIDKKTSKIDYRDGKPVVLSKKHKGDMEQKSKPKSNRGTSTVRKGKSSVDSTRNTASPTKRKK